MACVALKNEKELLNFNRCFLKATLFAFKRDTYDFAEVKYSAGQFTKFNQLIVLNQPPPYSSCSPNFGRFDCMQECFKRGFRLSEYFYNGNETGLVHLNQTKNESVRAHEASCFVQCQSLPCKLAYLSENEIDQTETAKAFRAQPVISRFDFSVQMTSLTCLIFGIVFSRLLHIATDLLNSKLRDRRKRRALFCLRVFIVCVCLLSCSYLFVRQMIGYHEKRTNPTRTETTRNLLRPETIHLVICLKTTYIFKELDCCKRFQNESMNMLQLEQATEGALNETIDSISLNYLGKKVAIPPSRVPKVMFASARDGYWFTNSHLSRCFQLEIQPLEPHYQTLLSISKLEIKFKHRYFQLFLLVKSGNLTENFNLESFHYIGGSTFLKRVERRSRLSGHCIDYETTYAQWGCTNRRNCIERCAQRSFFDLHHNVTNGTSEFGLVIHKEQFSEDEWAVAYLDTNSSAAEEFIESCKKQIPKGQEPCVNAAFETSVRVDQLDSKTRVIDLFYEEVTGVEEEPSLYKLLLDLLSIQSIFFGLTVLGLLTTTYKIVRTGLRARHRPKILLLIQLYCLVALIWHVSSTVDEILNGKLDFSQHFEILEHFPVPAIVLCLRYDHPEIVANRRLTGSYLEQLTSDLTAERIFKSITYMSKQNHWIELDPSNYSANADFEVESFFFLQKKCFSLQLKLTYDLSNLYLSSNDVLKLNFNWSSVDELSVMHFMAHLQKTMQFSKVLSVRFRTPDHHSYYNGKKYTNFHRFSYSISQDLLSIRSEDKFSVIKQLFKSPMSLFYDQDDSNDPNSYLFRLLRGFKEAHNKTTLNLPLEKDRFDLEIDETSFDSYFERFEQQRKPSVNTNFEREYPNLYLRRESRVHYFEQTAPDLSFNLIPFKKVGSLIIFMIFFCEN